MATLPTVDFTLKYERWLCKVKSELRYFHCWEHFSEPVPAGLTIGSPPAGVISYVVGIVEFDDGIRRVDLFDEFLAEKDIEVPCSDPDEEADRHADDNCACLYGMEYWNLVDKVEVILHKRL